VDAPDQQTGEMADVLRRNIETLRREREREDADASLQERIANSITGFTGSMPFVYLHLVLLALWLAVNLGWLPPLPRFDPSFVILAMVASVEAIFLSTFILISQNRSQASEQRRADLALQMNLLTEHEVTRLVRLVSALGERLNVAEARDPALAALKRDVDPEKVLEELDDPAA
jgi:uncharacterized membrane protein